MQRFRCGPTGPATATGIPVGGGCSGAGKNDPVLAGFGFDAVAFPNVSFQDFQRKLIFDIFLYDPFQRPGAVGRIIPLLDQEVFGAVRQFQFDLFVRQSLPKSSDLDLDDLADLIPCQAVKDNGLVNTVEELGPEMGLQRLRDPGGHLLGLPSAEIVDPLAADV